MGKDKVSEEYGSLLFTDAVMQERLPKPTYKELRQVIDDGPRSTSTSPTRSRTQ